MSFLELMTRPAQRKIIKENKGGKKLENWAENKGVMVIAGHTHRPVLPEPGEGMYLNDGSCVHPRCITAIEIEGDQITMVKWEVKTRPNNDMYVGREVVEGPYYIKEYFENLKQQ